VASEAFQYYPSFHLESSLFGFGLSLPCFFSDDSLGACSRLITSLVMFRCYFLQFLSASKGP